MTEGPERAHDLARAAAGDRDVRLGGGAATIRQYLDLGLVDELHLALVPALLGTGERLLHGLSDVFAGIGHGGLARHDQAAVGEGMLAHAGTLALTAGSTDPRWKSFAADMSSIGQPGGQPALDLIAGSDALIEGFRPGVMERLGLGPEVCAARNELSRLS